MQHSSTKLDITDVMTTSLKKLFLVEFQCNRVIFKPNFVWLQSRKPARSNAAQSGRGEVLKSRTRQPQE